MTNHPEGYWLTVYRHAGQLISASPGLDGETAFNLARELTDMEFGQPQLLTIKEKP
jgi:hypothetical protein